jgi:hypothetical protein
MTTNITARSRALAGVLGRKVEEVSYNQRVRCFTALVLDRGRAGFLSPITAYWVYPRGEAGFTRFEGCYKGQFTVDGQAYRVFSNES